MTARTQTKLKVGDRVMFSATFLRSTNQHTGDAPFFRGTVIDELDLHGWRLLTVKWDGFKQTTIAADANLIHEKRVAIDSARHT